MDYFNNTSIVVVVVVYVLLLTVTNIASHGNLMITINHFRKFCVKYITVTVTTVTRYVQ